MLMWKKTKKCKERKQNSICAPLVKHAQSRQRKQEVFSSVWVCNMGGITLQTRTLTDIHLAENALCHQQQKINGLGLKFLYLFTIKTSQRATAWHTWTFRNRVVQRKKSTPAEPTNVQHPIYTNCNQYAILFFWLMIVWTDTFILFHHRRNWFLHFLRLSLYWDEFCSVDYNICNPNWRKFQKTGGRQTWKTCFTSVTTVISDISRHSSVPMWTTAWKKQQVWSYR